MLTAVMTTRLDCQKRGPVLQVGMRILTQHAMCCPPSCQQSAHKVWEILRPTASDKRNSTFALSKTMERRGSSAAATAAAICVCSLFCPSGAFWQQVPNVRSIKCEQTREHVAVPRCRPSSRLPLHRGTSNRGGRRRKSPFTVVCAADPAGVAEGSSNSIPSDESQKINDVSAAVAPPAAAADAAAGDLADGGGLVDKGGVSKDRLAFEELGTREMDRLFSTLEPCDVSGFKRKPTNLLSAASLIAGTAVGAGILALPAATLQAGLLPSAVGLIMM